MTRYYGVVLAMPIRAQTKARWHGVDIKPMQTALRALGLHPGTGDAERGLKVVKESMKFQHDTWKLSQNGVWLPHWGNSEQE